MSRSGLTAAEAAERFARGEHNRVRRSEGAAYFAIVARNVLTLFNALVVPAAAALFWLDEFRDALAVSGMALTNLVLGLVQDIRAKRHLDRLTLLTETRVRVLRDGHCEELPAGDVVRGDLLLLSAGDAIVADGPVEEARYLEVDEALLTGESDPVPRRPGEPLLSGSFCVAGEGSYLAERVGAQSFAQRTAGQARSYHWSASPIQRSINRLILILTAAAIVLCCGYGAMYKVGDLPTKDLWRMIAATITSMVPQGLVLMATVAFVLGAVRLSRKGALVQRLNAVESMASVDTLCLDKTGTLTTNRLHLQEIRALDESMSEEVIRARLRLFASASLDRSSKAIVALRAALGETPVELLDQLPFKSQNRYSAVRVRLGSSETVLALGAVEALHPHCQPAAQARDVLAGAAGWQQMGLRVLLFAQSMSVPDKNFSGSLNGYNLHPLALVCLGDELRPNAGCVLEELAAQGIRFKILSGDHADTVRATVAPLAAEAKSAAVVALAQTPVLSGSELQDAADAEELIRTRCVFGRVSPSQKVQIVAALKKHGRYVAMIGDGVNDVLPIKTAHLGIAMGDGAAASKTVSGIVLETNDFSLLPDILDEGRTIIRNLRRAGKLFLVKNVFTLLLIVGALAVFGLPFPYLPRQVTLLNFLTIGVPAFLIMLCRDRAASASAPRFVREVGSFALRTGIIIGAAGLLLLGLSQRIWHDDEATQRTLLLSLLVLLGLTTLLRALRDGEARPSPGDRGFVWLAAAALGIYLLAMYVRPIGEFFVLTPLSPGQWGKLLLFVAGAYLALRASDVLCR